MAYHRLSFRIYTLSATYVWRDSRINGECSVYVVHLHTFAVDYVCFVFCGIPRVCLYICNCVIKIALCSFFHSRGSDVSNGPECSVGFFQCYLHGSLCICWGSLTSMMRSYWGCFPPPTRLFYFSVHLGYLWWHLRPLIINNCNGKLHQQSEHNRLFT